MGRPCSVAKVTAARSAAEPLHSLRQQEEVEFEPIRHFEFFKHMKQVVLDRMLAESELIAICLLLSLSKSCNYTHHVGGSTANTRWLSVIKETYIGGEFACPDYY